MLKMSEYCEYAKAIHDVGRFAILHEGKYVDWRGVEYTNYKTFANDLLVQLLEHREIADLQQDCTTLKILEILGYAN